MRNIEKYPVPSYEGLKSGLLLSPGQNHQNGTGYKGMTGMIGVAYLPCRRAALSPACSRCTEHCPLGVPAADCFHGGGAVAGLADSACTRCGTRVVPLPSRLRSEWQNLNTPRDLDP